MCRRSGTQCSIFIGGVKATSSAAKEQSPLCVCVCVCWGPAVLLLTTNRNTHSHRSAQIPGLWSPDATTFYTWHLMFVGAQYGSCFMLPFRSLKFWGGYYIYGKCVHSCIRISCGVADGPIMERASTTIGPYTPVLWRNSCVHNTQLSRQLTDIVWLETSTICIVPSWWFHWP